MKNAKTVACTAILVLTLSATTFAKSGTISATKTGTISATRVGTISATKTGTISATSTSEVAPLGSRVDSLKYGFFALWMMVLQIS